MSFTPEQLLERRKGLGASDSAAACGLSKWKTRLQLYLEKTGQAQPTDQEALHLEMGHALEPMILTRFERKQKLTVTNRQEKFVDPDWPKRWSTVDGISSDWGVVNAKSVGFADPREWGDESEDSAVPMEYLISSQHEMACTDLSFAWLPVVVLNRQFRIYRIERDDELIELVTNKEKEFMEMVEARTPPPPADLEDAKLLWPSHKTNKRVDADDDIAQAVRRLKRSKARAEKLGELQDALKLHIQRHMADAAELIYIGKPICTWKQAKPSMKFDEDAFALRHPRVYQKYLREVPGSRRMLLK